MKLQTLELKRKTLIAVGVAATLGMTAGMTACKRPDGQMSDSAAADAPKESASLGAALDDTGITAKVKESLSNDARTESAKIDVETNNGVVTLSGQADSAKAKDAAEELARNVAEVKGIDNRISAPSAIDDMSARADSAASNAGEAVSDAMITTKVKASFAADDQVKATAIKVDTDDGVVKLDGKVASDTARERAITIAKGINGVKSVDDDKLKVGSSS